MLPYKTLSAMVTAKLPVTEMSLHMRLDVFLSPKFLVTVWEQTRPFSITEVRAFDEGRDLINRNPGVFNCGIYRVIQVEI